MVHMRTANSVAIPDRGSGMVHHLAYRAAVDGKHPVSKKKRSTGLFAQTRRLTFAAVAFFMASASASYAQSGPFAGLAGTWSGGGTVTLDDGSRERIRCRATYQVGAGGNGLNQRLLCARHSYKFDLSSNVIAEGGSLSRTWRPSSQSLS